MSDSRRLRVMTYNVHGCVGTDGELSIERITAVIATYDPDVIALQELDVNRDRSRRVDQPHSIARQLRMHFHFHPAIEVQEERYGDAILSRYPMRLCHAAVLPTFPAVRYLQRRGALWVGLQVDGREVHVINTHLGLNRHERLAQTKALLGPDWVSHPACRSPLVLCGDFNAPPGSRSYRRCAARLTDVQKRVDHEKPKRTYPSRYPLLRIDHIFATDDLRTLSVQVPRTPLTRVASDHLPLIAELELP